MNPSLECASCLGTMGTAVISEHHSWNGISQMWPPPSEHPVPGALVGCHTAKSAWLGQPGHPPLTLIPVPAWQGTSPGRHRAQKQLPKELPEEPGGQAAAVAALAEVTEVVGQLAKEQCLWLWQGWGGQQGSGSLATLLQAWGLCSRGDTGEKGSVWEVRSIPMPFPAETASWEGKAF